MFILSGDDNQRETFGWAPNQYNKKTSFFKKWRKLTDWLTDNVIRIRMSSFCSTHTHTHTMFVCYRRGGGTPEAPGQERRRNNKNCFTIINEKYPACVCIFIYTLEDGPTGWTLKIKQKSASCRLFLTTVATQRSSVNSRRKRKSFCLIKGEE